MNYELLKAQSSFSLEEIFLIYLGIDPSDYKDYEGTFYWLKKSDEDYDWGDNDINRISRIYGMGKNFLNQHSSIITEDKLDGAYSLYNSLKVEVSSKSLKTHYIDTETEQVFILRKDIYEWFVEHDFDWPDELKPFNYESELESVRNKIKKLEESLRKQVEQNNELQNKVPENWRKAFEYESTGLNALYNLIETNFFDSSGKPIYDIKKLPKKKTLSSNWLKCRTLAEADTIITSGNRKGANDK